MTADIKILEGKSFDFKTCFEGNSKVELKKSFKQ